MSSCAKDRFELMAYGIWNLLWLNVTKMEFRVTCKEPAETNYNNKETMNTTYSSTVWWNRWANNSLRRRWIRILFAVSFVKKGRAASWYSPMRCNLRSSMIFWTRWPCTTFLHQLEEESWTLVLLSCSLDILLTPEDTWHRYRYNW